MAAFDRVLSGIPQMDEKIDNIRLGDNVVWRVDSLEDFKQFATPYVNQAIKDKRNLIYIRFASHEPLFTQQEGLKIVNVELSHRFENFTVKNRMIGTGMIGGKACGMLLARKIIENREPDYAEIGSANHAFYEKSQQKERTTRSDIPEGKCIFFDEAYKRGVLLKELDLSKVDVNMFGAVNNSLINDGCGLYRGRLILPFEHLSRFQTDVID